MLSRNSISHNVFYHAPRKQVLKCSSESCKKVTIHDPTEAARKH